MGWLLAMGLNRTSVGLKAMKGRRPRSETSVPQSNQRGIERELLLNSHSIDKAGLNRTSVGLKGDIVAMIISILNGLNRTSVGLKEEAND